MTAPFREPKRAIIIPGNGLDEDDNMNEVMWYGWAAKHLAKEFRLSVPLKTFPDPLYAHEEIWKAFAKDELDLDENTIIIGHSSGAACALRLMEEVRSAGCILVSGYDSDLGDDLERESGYFNRPFNYEKMRENTPWIIQFHAENDHLVPVDAARKVAKSLEKVKYVEHKKSGHFQFDTAEWLIDELRETLAKARSEQ